MPKTDNITRVAKEVINQAENKKLINLKEAMLAVGYSPSTAQHKSDRVVKSRKFIDTIQKQQDIIMERIADANKIMIKKQAKASYRDGVEAFDRLNKLQLLLSGDKPAVSISVNWE